MLGALAEDVERLQDIYLRTVFPAITALILYGAAVISFGTVDLGFALWMGLYLLFLIAAASHHAKDYMETESTIEKGEQPPIYAPYRRCTWPWRLAGQWSGCRVRSSSGGGEQRADSVRRSLRRWTRWRDLIAQCVIGLMVVSVTLWAGSQAAAGQLPAVMIAAFVLVLFPLTEALLPVSDAVERIPEYRQSLDRLQHLEGKGHAPGATSGRGETVQAAEAPSESAEMTDRSRDQRIRLRIPPKLRADIRIDHVSYRYASEDAHAVQGVSLHLPQGNG